jgi:nucleotide-binding universal stress UspA family protein
VSRALNCSASRSFLRNANLEVIELAQQQQQQEISKIVVPIDGSKNSMEAADYAVKMAQKYGSEVAVVHIVNLDQNLQLLGIYRLSYPDPIKKKVEEARLRHKSGLLK